MVDWEWVDRKRSEGWSWTEIASDRRSEFEARSSGVPPGRQLRTLSRARPASPPGSPVGPSESPRPRRWSLARVGWILFPLLAPWTLLAFLLPSPVGVYVPVVPLLGFATAVAGAVLAFGSLRASPRWSPVFKRTATVGAVAGLVVAGSLGSLALLSGCPTLSPFTTSEPGGWERVPQAHWSDGGKPVTFFYGSVACPFCSATSWAVLAALERLGNVTGIVYDNSSPSDVYPHTPSVVLGALVVANAYTSLDARESTDDQKVTAPATASCLEQAYLSAYDPLGSIPLLVLGGTFVHVGTLVDPGALSGLTPAEVSQQLASGHGSAAAAVDSGAIYLLAYLVWLNAGEPASVATNSSVAAIVGGIR